MLDQRKTGVLIAKKRKEKNLTQTTLASYLGITDRAVSKWENGTSDPSTSNFFALAKLYGVSVEELLKEIE